MKNNHIEELKRIASNLAIEFGFLLNSYDRNSDGVELDSLSHSIRELHELVGQLDPEEDDELVEENA